MNNVQIDIIVTHYDEPWETGKPFFDMLQSQRLADMSKVNIILVQDGAEYTLDWTNLLSQYSYPVKILTINHSGPAAARNFGLNYTNGEWVMFCDFDDMLCDACSLAMMLDNLPTDECDIIWGKYLVEIPWRKGLPYFQAEKKAIFNNTICKMYRTQALDDKHIRFNESIKYMYEYAFNAVCLTEIPPHRIRALTTEFYPYIKTYRKNSHHTTPYFYAHSSEMLFYMHIKIAVELYERGYPDDSTLFYARALCAAFYAVHDPESDTKLIPDRDIVIGFYNRCKDMLKTVSDTDMEALLDEACTMSMNYIQHMFNEHRMEYYFANDTLSFNEWVDTLVYVQDKNEASDKPVVPSGLEHEDISFDMRQAQLNQQKPQVIRQPRIAVYCGTPNVYDEMITSCKSLLMNTPIDKVYFLTEDDRFMSDLPDIIECINVQDQKYFPHDGPNYENSWTYMCMMRAAYPEIFMDYDKILSLDVDVIVNDDVSDLWDYDLSDYYLAGVPEKQRQKTLDDPIYINFGVVMMNLAKLRQDNKQEEIISTLNNRRVDCPEQTAYNEACAYHILELSSDYNNTVYTHITQKAEKERILHYAGQTFWKHYASVKRYHDMSWDTIMSRQNALKGVT